MVMLVWSGSLKSQCFQGMNISVNNSTEHPDDNLVHVNSAIVSENLAH